MAVEVIVTEQFGDGMPREAFCFDTDCKVTDWLRIVPLPVLQAPIPGACFPFEVRMCLN